MRNRTWPSRALIALILCASMIAGCKSTLPPPEPQTAAAPTSPGLLKLCPPLTELKKGTAAAVMQNRTQRAEQYADCRLTHERLVQSVKLRETLKQIEEDDDE